MNLGHNNRSRTPKVDRGEASEVLDYPSATSLRAGWSAPNQLRPKWPTALVRPLSLPREASGLEGPPKERFVFLLAITDHNSPRRAIEPPRALE